VSSVESDAEPTLDPDGETVLFSDEKFPPATFTFDTAALVWERGKASGRCHSPAAPSLPMDCKHL
jgi:hypothetical protein